MLRGGAIMTQKLAQLVGYLDSLDERAALADLAARVRACDIDLEELLPFVRFSEKTYSRNLVRAGTWYNLLVLCWRNGQRSPIHDHRGSSCAVRVLKGVLTETRFDFAPNGHIKAMGSRDFEAGSVIASFDDDVHQVSNLQAGAADLITMHVYSPPLNIMGTYSLTSDRRGEEPMLLEFCEAAGI
jgi:cysteine dioxygenase